MSETEKPRKKRKKLQRTRTPMAEQKASDRVQNFNEVPLGYTPEEAKQEAERCLQCKKEKPCIDGCPVNVDINGLDSQGGGSNESASDR